MAVTGVNLHERRVICTSVTNCDRIFSVTIDILYLYATITVILISRLGNLNRTVSGSR